MASSSFQQGVHDLHEESQDRPAIPDELGSIADHEDPTPPLGHAEGIQRRSVAISRAASSFSAVRRWLGGGGWRGVGIGVIGISSVRDVGLAWRP